MVIVYFILFYFFIFLVCQSGMEFVCRERGREGGNLNGVFEGELLFSIGWALTGRGRKGGDGAVVFDGMC